MNVLIIGGTRFLGAAIARELLRRKHAVTVLHRGNTPGNLPQQVKHILGDARDRDAVEPVLAGGAFDAVVDTILSADDLAWLLPAAHRFTGQLVHCGSTGVYAPAAAVPIREDDPTPCPPELGGFGWKLLQDQTLLDFHERTGFKVCSLRVSNVFGEGDVPLDGLGGRDPGYFQALADHQEVRIPLDGRSLLQPVHTDDLARGFCAALESDKAAGQIYNLSSDRAVSLMHYIEVAKDLLASSSRVCCVSLDEALADGHVNEAGLRFVVEHMCIDSSKARRDLGYIPRVSVRQGLADSFRWMIEKGLLRADASRLTKDFRSIDCSFML